MNKVEPENASSQASMGTISQNGEKFQNEQEEINDPVVKREFTVNENIAPPPPPPYEPSFTDASRWSAEGTLTSSEALSSLDFHIENNYCWGRGPMKNMKISKVTPTTAYKYILTTYAERRRLDWEKRPWKLNEKIDGPDMGEAPEAWQIKMEIPNFFIEKTFKTAVPHTEELKICETCVGDKRVPCRPCRGRGYTKTNDKRRTCRYCNGYGDVTCPECKGTGKMVDYLQLTVTFQNHEDNFVHEITDLPDELILTVDGEELLSEVDKRVGSIVNFFLDDINEASKNLTEKHATEWTDKVIHQQRQLLTAVPVFEVTYKLGSGETGRFWVYGSEKSIFSIDYPAQCCCCCICNSCDNCACCNDSSCAIL